MEKSIQIAVIKADLILCHIASLPWGKIMIVAAILMLLGWVVRRA